MSDSTAELPVEFPLAAIAHPACRGLSPQQAMRHHLRVLEDLLNDLGNRSARHVMTRADMLILEVMINLAGR